VVAEKELGGREEEKRRRVGRTGNKWSEADDLRQDKKSQNLRDRLQKVNLVVEHKIPAKSSVGMVSRNSLETKFLGRTKSGYSTHILLTLGQIFLRAHVLMGITPKFCVAEKITCRCLK
jgi:hypothetical protein